MKPTQLYASVEKILAPETLSELLQTSVKYVHCRAFGGVSHFSNRLLTVEIGSKANARFVLKRMRMVGDWTMRASADTKCRSVTLWQYGLLDRLPPQVEHPIVACCRDEEGWAILMHDISAGLFQAHQPFSLQTITRLLDGVAAMHAKFWQAPVSYIENRRSL